MKVTFFEEIEAKKAWRNSMYCSKCGGYKYEIHHQLMPNTRTGWWVQCLKCGFETTHTDTREDAIKRWKLC